MAISKRWQLIEKTLLGLLSEYATHALTGGLYCQILPLLNGKHSYDALVQKLDGQVSQEHFDYVLDRLHEKGYLTDADHPLSPEVAAFWSGLGAEPALVATQLPQMRVSVISVGAENPQPLVEALGAIGVSVQRAEESGGVHALQVVLTDDYQQPELATINQKALQSGQPWMLVKPSGHTLWLGPIFHPGKTGCWDCLMQRLQGNREVEASVLLQKAKQEGRREGETRVFACGVGGTAFDGTNRDRSCHNRNCKVAGETS